MRWYDANLEKPTDKEIEYILCISGVDDNITYDHAVVTDCSYEDGKFFIHGAYKENITVHAWMTLPEAPDLEQLHHDTSKNLTFKQAISILNMVEAHGLADKAKALAIKALKSQNGMSEYCQRRRRDCLDCKCWDKVSDVCMNDFIIGVDLAKRVE